MPNFVGLPLGQMLTVFAVVGGLTVVFYILKLKRRPIAVPFSPIWERILRDKEATSLFSQLKRLLSLLLQLLMIALLVLALGDPRTSQNLAEGRNVVVLIDVSASMQATDVSPSRLEEGKRKLKDVVRGLGASDRMLIAQMDGGTTPLSTMTGDIPELERALASVTPSDTRADFERGLRFAEDTLLGLPSPEIVVVSDGALSPPSGMQGLAPGMKLSYMPLGESSKNAAITAFSVRRYPLDKSRYEAMIELTSTANEDLDLELRLYGDDSLTETSRLILKAGERLPRFLPNLGGASHQLRAEISLYVPPSEDGSPTPVVHDDLPVDDVAYALMPERRRSRVQQVTSGNTYLEAALLLDEYIEVVTVDPKDYPAPGQFDVTIIDGPLDRSPTPESGHVLYLNPGGSNLPFKIDREIADDDPNISLGFDTLETTSPILAHTQLSDVNIAKAKILKGEKEDKVLGASFKGPLLIEGRREGRKFVALGLDVRDSDLPLRTSWPLFVLNVINTFVEEDTGYISSFQTGTVFHVPVPSTSTSMFLADPAGAWREVPVDEGRAVYLGKKAGFYEVADVVPAEGSAPPQFRTAFAANLSDPIESKIEPQSELRVGATVAGEVSGFTVGVRREIWMLLLLAVLALSALEWLTYHRRTTV